MISFDRIESIKNRSRYLMFTIHNELTLKNIDCKFCYSSTMEEIMCFHVMADPMLHTACGSWVMHIHDRLSQKLRNEIDAIGAAYSSWFYILDVFGTLVDESANYKCDLELMLERLAAMDDAEFLYIFIGLGVSEYHISLEEFTEWYLDIPSLLSRLEGMGYNLLALSDGEYALRNCAQLKERISFVLRQFWVEAFEKEWISISGYVEEIITHEELALRHTTLLQYLSHFHNRLELTDDMLIFNKTPQLCIKVEDIYSLVITPTIFGDSHLHGNIYRGKVNLSLSLNSKALLLRQEPPESFFLLLRAISDETRFKILRVLWNEDATTKEISDILRLSQSTVSLHLKQLKEADLVTSHKFKKFVYYQIKKEQLLSLQELLLEYIQ